MAQTERINKEYAEKKLIGKKFRSEGVTHEITEIVYYNTGDGEGNILHGVTDQGDFVPCKFFLTVAEGGISDVDKLAHRRR